ncbi:MAG: flagellar assembly protein FliW [Nitrospinae bacterium]|nr:flagellar assembly protein FliW [Nitrospinota bacterium]
MQINTLRFGTIEIDKSEIIIVPEGIIGFPDIKRYVILDMGRDTPFKLFQAVDEPTVGFVIIDPILFKPDYKVKIRREDLYSLSAENLNEIVTAVIVTIPEDLYKMTANLRGPLLMNLKSRLAKQHVLTDDTYTTRYWIITHDESAQVGAA